MVSQVTTGSTFSNTSPRPLFVNRDGGMTVNGFVVSADGQRFFYTAPNPGAAAHEINLVLNWVQELKTKSAGR